MSFKPKMISQGWNHVRVATPTARQKNIHALPKDSYSSCMIKFELKDFQVVLWIFY